MGLLPQWLKELDFKDFFSSVSRDAVNATKLVSTAMNPVAIPANKNIGSVFKKVGESVSSGLKKVFSFLSPTLILIGIILLLILIFWKKITAIFIKSS